MSSPSLRLGTPLVHAALVGILTIAIVPVATAEEPAKEICEGFGPQSGRDITKNEGTNSVVFSHALPASELNLCNVHFHKNAEHKGPGFSKFVGDGSYDGYACNESGDPEGETVCENVQAGETVEFHWVYTSCDIGRPKPGKGLAACLSEICPNPQLRVEAQVFRVEAGRGEDLAAYATEAPAGDGIVTYLGSTTGSMFSDQTCSPLQVTWSVRSECRSIDAAGLAAWCRHNPFDERRAHGVRQLVTELPLLSKIED